ncbi:unnamed protein product, partial [Rotaria sp. Silwood2]
LTPPIFNRKYAMHMDYRHAVISVVFALLPNKNQQTYQGLIDKL